MALTTVTVRPSAVALAGVSTTVGAANAAVALSDSSDTTYVQFAQQARLLESQTLRLTFPTPTVPAGAKVYSVTLRIRIQTVTPGADVPVCHHWLRAPDGTPVLVGGQIPDPLRLFFNTQCPVSQTTTSQWVDQTISTWTAGPGGQPWDVTTNLATPTYELGRGDDSTTSTLRVAAVYLDITYQQLSSVTVTAPTGTSTDTRPTIKWTYSSPDNQPQQASRVAIYTAAQVAAPGFTPFTTTPIQDSGLVLGEVQQWTATADITDGTYYAYVEAQSRWPGLGDFYTAVASTTWTRAATPVNPPPAAVLQSAYYDRDTGRVVLTYLPGGTTPATTTFTVEASRNGGQSWAAIPRLTRTPANGMTPVTDYDYVAPLNADSIYRVIAYNGTPLNAATAPSNYLTVKPVDNRFWLKNPNNPLQNTVLAVATSKDQPGIKRTITQMQGYFEPVSSSTGTAEPIHVDGPSYGYRYRLELHYGDGISGFSRDDELDWLWPAMDQLVQTTGGIPLLFQQPNATQGWVRPGSASSGQDTEDTYDAVPGNRTKDRYRRRKLTLSPTRTPAFY